MKLSQPIYEAVLIKTNMFMYGYPRERFSLHERELVSNFMTAMFLCCSTSYNVLRRVYGLEKKLSFASTLKILLSLRCSTSYHTLRRAWYLRCSTSYAQESMVSALLHLISYAQESMVSALFHLKQFAQSRIRYASAAPASRYPNVTIHCINVALENGRFKRRHCHYV